MATPAGPLDGDALLAALSDAMSELLIELERGNVVRENRSMFQDAMQQRFIDTVQRLSGRSVEQFISSHNIGPDLEIELFFLAAP
jgi:2C-methyl-D-erythritol 2,4-cyclodiphosphate synthase